MNKRELHLLKRRITHQIRDHETNMYAKHKQFDFYEGRKIEAKVILGWLEKY